VVLLQLLAQQKNMMDQFLDNKPWKFKYIKICFSRLQELKHAALAFGGQIPPNTGATEEYNG
jgi:hypothetical protein